MNQDKTIMNQEKTIILACSSLTEYVEAGIHLLEKLFSGKWDDQFLVLEPGRAVQKEEMLV